MRLILAEKPSVAKAIAQAKGGFTMSESRKFLSNKKDCIITWAFGHLVEMHHKTHNDIMKLPILPTGDEWELQVISGDGYKEQFENIKKLVEHQNVTEVVNACDAGREGEFIGRLIYLKTGTNKPLKRMWINSMTKQGLLAAYDQICDADKYEGLNRAAFCRSEMDWCIGLNGSIAATAVLTKKTNISQITEIGRVKTAVTAMVVRLEREIQNFVPEKFWEIEANFKAKTANQNFVGKWVNYEELIKRKNTKKVDTSETEDAEKAENSKDEQSDSIYRFKDEDAVKKVLADCRDGSSWKPASKIIENKTLRKRNAPHLFDLAGIQVLANNLFKFSSKQTLDIIQELYMTHQAVTYPRTESTHLPSDYPAECLQTFDKLAAAKHNTAICEFAEEAKARVKDVGKHIFDSSKVSDHFAIIPTGVIPNLENDQNAKKIYHLIVRRFKEAFLPPQEYNETERFTFIGEHAFRSVGEEIITVGWKVIQDKDKSTEKKEAKKTDSILPTVNGHSDIETESIKGLAKKTTPPIRDKNGTLLNAMKTISRTMKGDQKEALKSCGIGTPATRATIIDELHATSNAAGKPKKAVLEERGKSKEIFPTEYGMSVIEFLEENGINQLITPEFTADLEMGLTEITKNPQKSVDFMRETHSLVTNFIRKLQKAHNDIPVRKLTGAVCPSCQSEITIEPRFVRCESCTFSLQRVVAQKTLDNSDLVSLITHGKTGAIDGFVKGSANDKGKVKHFTAHLELFKNEKGENAIRFFIPKEKYQHNCPICNSEMTKSLNGVECQNNDCKLMVWANRNGKRLSDETIAQLIETGHTDQINGFVSMDKKTTFNAKLKILHAEKKVVLDYEGVEKANNEEQTKIKCIKQNCTGTYVKSDFKYSCKTCQMYIVKGLKKQVAFSDAQLKKLLKGETIVHPFTPVVDGEAIKAETKPMNWYIDKASGILKKSEIKDI